VTDGQTDGQNYDSQNRASIAASRGKNCFCVCAPTTVYCQLHAVRSVHKCRCHRFKLTYRYTFRSLECWSRSAVAQKTLSTIQYCTVVSLMKTLTTAKQHGFNSGCPLKSNFTARRNAGIPSAVLATAIPSVCLSVTRWYCGKTTAHSTVQFALSDSKMCLVL